MPWFREGLAGLEVGAGTGLLTLELASSFQRITGFDVSTKMLDVMRSKVQERLGDRVTVTSGPLHTLGRFDVIFSLLAMHHIKDVSVLVRQLGRQHLNPGGRLLVVDLEATANVRRFHKPQDQMGEHYEHDGFDEATVRSWFKGDFGEVDYMTKPISKKLHKDWDPNEADEEFQLFFASSVKFGCDFW